MIPEEYMLERKWEVKENKDRRITYTGYFVANQRRWEGRILVIRKDEICKVKPFILDPPPEIQNLPQGRCFRLIKDGWFEVHWEKPPTTASDCLVYLENLFSKAIGSSS